MPYLNSWNGNYRMIIIVWCVDMVTERPFQMLITTYNRKSYGLPFFCCLALIEDVVYVWFREYINATALALLCTISLYLFILHRLLTRSYLREDWPLVFPSLWSLNVHTVPKLSGVSKRYADKCLFLGEKDYVQLDFCFTRKKLLVGAISSVLSSVWNNGGKFPPGLFFWRPVYSSHGQLEVSNTTLLHPRRPSEQIVEIKRASFP